ncbi:MAG: aldehyde ferredoxin oxidoreductase family protein [Dehalococcoidia bacterium]|nr:aldehyde ferredoxin oxidoreductase family protein [Dehalococcoidia bacterium]
MARGYMGKILFVDLSKHKLRDEALDEKLCRQFIGGYGIGARILFSGQKAGVDPLGPDNTLGILSGPFTGTSALSGTRFTVVGKSPLTGGWGDANSGGYFGAFMKFAGYDALFFTGISAKPVYLFINNSRAELRDAAHIWGKDTRQTEEILKSELGKDVEVACIGPSGEKLSHIAAVFNRTRTAARSGLGAVMGSKKLKAVVVKGNMKVPVADEERTKELRKKCAAELGGHIAWLKPFGTPFLVDIGVLSGDSPVKNWAGVGVIDFPDFQPIAKEAVIARMTKKFACYMCPIGCGGYMKAGTGEYKYEAGSRRPEYETTAMFGTNCLNNNLESIIKAADICDRYGIDTISAGAGIALAIECYEKGLITKKDTDGIEMTWGNHKAIVAMTEKLAKREGFGDVLADGVKVAAEKIGKGADKYAVHVGGQELPAHDPKHAFYLATSYRMDPTPGRHFVGSELSDAPYHPAGLLPKFDLKSFSGRGEARKIGSSFHQVVVCTGTCLFVYWAFPNVDPIADFMRAVTGWDVTNEELLKTGERIANIRQAFNIREGLNPLKFKVSDRVLGRPPLKAGPLAGVTIDEDIMIKEYLTAMDWDLKTAKPSRKKLLELGLADVAQELWP